MICRKLISFLLFIIISFYSEFSYSISFYTLLEKLPLETELAVGFLHRSVEPSAYLKVYKKIANIDNVFSSNYDISSLRNRLCGNWGKTTAWVDMDDTGTNSIQTIFVGFGHVNHHKVLYTEGETLAWLQKDKGVTYKRVNRVFLLNRFDCWTNVNRINSDKNFTKRLSKYGYEGDEHMDLGLTLGAFPFTEMAQHHISGLGVRIFGTLSRLTILGFNTKSICVGYRLHWTNDQQFGATLPATTVISTQNAVDYKDVLRTMIQVRISESHLDLSRELLDDKHFARYLNTSNWTLSNYIFFPTVMFLNGYIHTFINRGSIICDRYTIANHDNIIAVAIYIKYPCDFRFNTLGSGGDGYKGGNLINVKNAFLGVERQSGALDKNDYAILCTAWYRGGVYLTNYGTIRGSLWDNHTSFLGPLFYIKNYGSIEGYEITLHKHVYHSKNFPGNAVELAAYKNRKILSNYASGNIKVKHLECKTIKNYGTIETDKCITESFVNHGTLTVTDRNEITNAAFVRNFWPLNTSTLIMDHIHLTETSIFHTRYITNKVLFVYYSIAHTLGSKVLIKYNFTTDEIVPKSYTYYTLANMGVTTINKKIALKFSNEATLNIPSTIDLTTNYLTNKRNIYITDQGPFLLTNGRCRSTVGSVITGYKISFNENYRNVGIIKTRSGGEVTVLDNNCSNAQSGQIISDNIKFMNTQSVREFSNYGSIKANKIFINDNHTPFTLKNNGIINFFSGNNFKLDNKGNFFVNSKKAVQESPRNKYFDKIENKAGATHLVLEDLQEPAKLTYPLLLANKIVFNSHSKLILEQDASSYNEAALQQNLNIPKNITILKADTLAGNDLYNKVFRGNYLLYIKDVTDKKYVLKVSKFSVATTGRHPKVSATIEWQAMPDPNNFPSLDNDNCYSLRDINIFFGVVVDGLFIIEQDQKDIYHIRQKKIIIGRKTPKSSLERITIDSSKPNINSAAITFRLMKSININHITTEAAIDATLDIHTNKIVSNIAVNICPDISIANTINSIVGSKQYLLSMPSLQLVNGFINQGVIQGKYGINIALPIKGDINNKGTIIGKDAAIKTNGPSSMIDGNIENSGIIKSNKYAILMDTNASHHVKFSEYASYIQSLRKSTFLSIINNGTIEGNITSSGDIYLQNNFFLGDFNKTNNIEHIYGTLQLDNQDNLWIKEIKNNTNATITVSNSNIIKADTIKINQLENKQKGNIITNNLYLSEMDSKNEGSITVTNLQLSNATFNNSSGGRIIVDNLQQQGGNITNENSSYFAVNEIKPQTRNKKQIIYNNKNNSVLKITRPINNPLLSINNEQSALDMIYNSQFKQYNSNSAVIRVLIPDNLNTITTTPIIKLDGDAIFTNKLAKSSRFALYAKAPLILPYEVTVTIIEANNIRITDLKNMDKQLKSFFAGVNINSSTKANQNIIIMLNPTLDTNSKPNKLQVQLRWYNIKGGFPKVDNFHTYDMNEAFLSHLPFIYGLRVIEYDRNEYWYIAKREVILGKKYANDSAKNIYASANLTEKQAVTIEVNNPISIKKIILDGTIDASKDIIHKNNMPNKSALLITGKELTVTEGIHITANSRLIASLTTTLSTTKTKKSTTKTKKVSALLLENTITANIYNHGEIRGLNGIGIAGNANLLHGTITNYNKIEVINNIIYSSATAKPTMNKRKFIFCNEQAATATGGSCLLSGNNINIINKGFLQVTTLTHINTTSKFENQSGAIFKLKNNQNINSTLTMTNQGVIASAGILNFTSFQNKDKANLTANKLILVNDSSNNGTIYIGNLENNKIFDNQLKANLTISGTLGLYVENSKFINKGNLTVLGSLCLSNNFTNLGNITANVLVDNNHQLINKKFMHIIGTSGLTLNPNIENKEYFIVNATLSVASNYTSFGNWLVGGFFTKNSKFTNKSGYKLKIATNDLVINAKNDITNEGTFEVVNAVKLKSNFDNAGILTATTLKGIITNIPEFNNNGNHHSRFDIIKDVIINNYATLIVNKEIQGNVTVNFNKITLGKLVTQSGQLTAGSIYSKGKFIIAGKANIIDCLTADFLEVNTIKTQPIKLTAKNIRIRDQIINYAIIDTVNIKLPSLTTQYGGKLSITGASGLDIDNPILNHGVINITSALNIVKPFSLNGTITADRLTTAINCNCILSADAKVTLANIGDANTSNQKITIINDGNLLLRSYANIIKVMGYITVHKNHDYRIDGVININNDLQQDGWLELGKINALNPLAYTLTPNSTAQFTEPILQPNISLINSGTFDLQPGSSFKSHKYFNKGNLTLSVVKFINHSTKTVLLTLDKLILNQQKTNNNFILKPALNKLLLDPTIINKPITLYLMKINDNIVYLDNNKQQHIIDRVRNDINNYLNLTVESIHGLSFSVYSKISSSVISSAQALQSGARYLYVTIAPTLTYKLKNKNMQFKLQTLYTSEVGNHCIQKDSNTWGVCWCNNIKSPNTIYDNNLIISPYYIIAEQNIASYNNNNLIIGSGIQNTLYVTAANIPAFIIGCKVENAATPNIKQLSFNNISFSNIHITGREIIYPHSGVTNRDALLINGNTSIIIDNKFNIDQNSSFIAGFNKHAFHIAAPIIGNIVNQGKIGDSQSGYGIYISSAVSLTIDNHNTIEGILASLKLEPASHYQNIKTNLIINNNYKITGSILLATQHASTTINNIAYITADKIIANSDTFLLNNKNTGEIIANEISATNIINHNILKINGDKVFVVDHNITTTKDLFIKNMLLADNFSCSGSVTAIYFDAKGYKLTNTDFNKFSYIKDAIIDKCRLLEINKNIDGNVSLLSDLTLGADVNINKNSNLVLYTKINYNNKYLINYGTVTAIANKFILNNHFLNQINANLKVDNILQTQGSITIFGNVSANVLQPIITGSITINKNSILTLTIIDNNLPTAPLDFNISGTLKLTNVSLQPVISGNINISTINTQGSLLLDNNIKQIKGILTVDSIKTFSNITIEVTNTKFTEIITNNQLFIENKNKFQIPCKSSISSYKSNANSQLIIPIKQYFNLIDYSLLHFTNNVYLDKSSKITLVIDENFSLPIQRRTRIKIISSDNILLTTANTQLHLSDVQNMFSKLALQHREIKAIKDSIRIEDNGHSLVADFELIDASILPTGMHAVEIPLYEKLIGKCQKQETNISGISLGNLVAMQNYIAVAPYFMAVYSKLITFANNQLTIGTTTVNNTIKVEDYTSPAVVISIQANPITFIANPIIAIDSINIVNQDINGYQFAYKTMLGKKANQDGLLITRNNNTRKLATKINIDANSVISAGAKQHALHVAIPIIGEIENNGTIGLPNTGFAVHLSQLIDGNLTNNNIIEAKIAAINIDLNSSTNSKLTITNNKEIRGDILINVAPHMSQVADITLHNNKGAYIIANTIKTNIKAPLNLVNNNEAVIKVNNLNIAHAINNGMISIIASELKYINFDNRSMLYLQDLTIDTSNNFTNTGIMHSTGEITLKKDFSSIGTITANVLMGNNHYITKLAYGKFTTLDSIKVKANVFCVSGNINNNVVIENTLTILGNVSQKGNLSAKNIIGLTNLSIYGKTTVTNKLELNTLQVNNLASLTTETIKCEQLLHNIGTILTTNLENKNTQQIIQAGKLTILGSKTVILNDTFEQHGTTDISNASVKVNSDFKVEGSLVAKNLLVDYLPIKDFIRIDINTNSTILIKENLGDINNLNKKIIFVNDGNLILNKNSNIYGNIAIYNKNYLPQLAITGVLEITGNITQQGNLNLGKFFANNNSQLTINPNSIVNCNSEMQQTNISIVNNATLEIAQGSSLNNYLGKSTSCLILAFDNIKTIKSITNPILKLDLQAIFDSKATIKLKPKTRITTTSATNTIYLINATKGIVDTQGNNITNVNSLVKSMYTDSMLLKINKVYLINNNKSLVAELNLSIIFPDPNMKVARMQMLHSLLGDCQPEDELLETICWDYKKNKTNNLLVFPAILALDKIAIYDPTTEEFIIDSQLKLGDKTLYANNKPAINIGTTISDNKLAINPNDDISLVKMQFKNLNINAAKTNPLLNLATKTSDEDGIIITGTNSLVLYDQMIIENTVKIIAGKNHHALHFAAPIIGNINNYGQLGVDKSGYGLAITQPLKGEFKNYNLITGTKAAILINPLVSYTGKPLTIINEGTIIGSIIITAKNNITCPDFKLKNLANIKADEISCSKNLELSLINASTATISTTKLDVQDIINSGTIDVANFHVYSIRNDGNIIVTNFMTLYDDIIDYGNIDANIIDGQGYQLNSKINTLKVSTLKTIAITNNLPVSLREKTIGSVYIENKLNINQAYNVIIDPSSTLEVGSLEIKGSLKNYNQLIVNNTDILLVGSLTNNGTIKTNNILGASCTVMNNTGAILSLQSLGSNKNNMVIYNLGEIRLTEIPENTEKDKIGIIDGNIYINQANTKQHDGELNLYTTAYQQNSSNLYLGLIKSVNKNTFYLDEKAKTVVTKTINQQDLSIDNNGSIALQPLSIIDNYKGYSTSKLVIPIASRLASYGSNALLTIEDNCVFNSGCKLLLSLSEVLQNSILQQKNKINLLKIKNLITSDEKTITKQAIKDIITFNHTELIITLDLNDIEISKDDNDDYTMVSIVIMATGKLPDNFSYGSILLDKDILSECQMKTKKVSCFFYAENFDAGANPTTCNLGIYPAFEVIDPANIIINQGNIQIGSPTSKTNISISKYYGDYPALILSTSIEAEDITIDNDTVLEFNSLNISNVDITGKHSYYSSDQFFPQDGLLIIGKNTLKINQDIIINENSSLHAGENRHALHLAAPIEANITNLGVIGDNICGSGIRINNSFEGKITNLGIISASNTAIDIDVDVSSVINFNNCSINNQKQINGSIVANVKDSPLAQTILNSSTLTLANHATITLTNYAEINSCHQLIDNDLLSINLINRKGNINATDIAVKLIDNHAVIQKVASLGLVNNKFINNNNAKLKLISGSTITINNNNFINNGEIYAFNISLSNNFDNHGLITVANILNGTSYNFSLDAKSKLEPHTIKNIHLTGNTERLKVKASILGTTIIDGVLLLRQSISQLGNLNAKEIIVNNKYPSNVFTINGTVDSPNCRLMHLQNELSGYLQTNKLTLKQQSVNNGVIKTTDIIVDAELINNGTISVTNDILLNDYIINRGYIETVKNISISPECSNYGTLVANILNSATPSNLLNDGNIKISNLGELNSNINIVNNGDLILNDNAIIQGSIVITNKFIKPHGDFLLKNGKLTLEGVDLKNNTTFTIDNNSYAVLTANLDQEKLSIINNATLEIANYNIIDTYDGRNSDLILTLSQELKLISAPILNCKQHAIFNSNSKILLKPNIVISHITEKTITLVYANKGIKYDITDNTNLPSLIDLSTSNLSNLVIDSIANNSLFFKIYNPQIEDHNKKLTCKVKLIYDIKEIDKNMMYASILIDKDLVGKCIQTTKSIFAIAWGCNKNNNNITSNNLAISPLTLILKENIISYNCKDNILIISAGTTAYANTKQLTAYNDIASIIISSDIESNYKVVDIDKTNALELNGIQIDNINILGTNNTQGDNIAVDAILLTGKHPLKISNDSAFNISKTAILKATGDKHALHLAVKFNGKINNYGVIGSKDSANAIYISQPILATIVNYNVIAGEGAAIELCATRRWGLNSGSLTIINNGNIDGNLLFTTASSSTKVNYATHIENNKLITANSIIAKNDMLLTINNNSLINVNTAKINSLINHGTINVVGDRGLTIDKYAANYKYINASYFNVNNNTFINAKSAVANFKHLTNANIENSGLLLVTSELSGNISVDSTITLADTIKQTGILTTNSLATHNTQLTVLGTFKVNDDIKLQHLENISTSIIYSKKALIIAGSITNNGLIDVAYFQPKLVFTNNKSGNLQVRDGKLIINNFNLINLGNIKAKNLMLDGTFTNQGIITADNFSGQKNVLVAVASSQITANNLKDITILGTADVAVTSKISGKVNISNQLSLSGNVTDTGDLQLGLVNFNNYKLTIANNGSIIVTATKDFAIEDTTFANYGTTTIEHNLSLKNRFTNNGYLESHFFNGNKHNFINNKNAEFTIIQDSIIINNASITVNKTILGDNIIDGKLNIGNKVLQTGILSVTSIEAINSSEFIIDNYSNANITCLYNDKLNIVNKGNLVVQGTMYVNSYKAPGGMLTLIVDSKLTNAPFLQAKQDVQLNSYYDKQAMITITATEALSGFNKHKVIIATAKSFLANDKIILDTDLSYLLAVKKIASSSLLLNISNVGIDRNETQEAIYADLEYINISTIKKLKEQPVSIRRFASYLQSSKILQLELYIVELIRHEIKSYRLHPEAENKIIYFLQQHHPKTYTNLISKIQNKILDNIDIDKQDSEYAEFIKIITAYLNQYYQQQIPEKHDINLATIGKKYTGTGTGTIKHNTLHISDKVVQNTNISVNKIDANNPSEFYITNNTKVKINNFNNSNIDLVNYGFLAVTNNLTVNSYNSWGGCLTINLANLSNKPIMVVNNDANFNDSHGNKSQLILTATNFNRVGAKKANIVLLQANNITLNNEFLLDTDLENILAMQQLNSILLQLSNPRITRENNTQKIIVDLTWLDAKKLLLTDNNPISLVKFASILQQANTQQQKNITGNVNKNEFKITENILQTGTFTAKKLIADNDTTFTINYDSVANIDIIDNPLINIVNNGTLKTYPGIQVKSYTTNAGNLVFNINNLNNQTFIQAEDNIEFNSYNDKLPSIILQYSAANTKNNIHNIIVAKAKKLLLDGHSLLEADIINLVKYQKIASSSILCKLDNISILRNTSDEAIHAELSIIDVKDIKIIDDKPISVKQLAELMQQTNLTSSNNTVLDFIQKQITQGNMPSEMHSIYTKIAKASQTEQKLGQVINNIENSNNNDDSNLFAHLNELLPDNSAANLQSLFSLSKQSLLSINNHNAIQANFNFLSNSYFCLNEKKSLSTPLWFNVKQINYTTNNTANYFNAQTKAEVYSMGLEKNYHKIKVGYLLNYGIATTANLYINKHNKNTSNKVTSIVSAIYSNYKINKFTSTAGILIAKNKHSCANDNTNYNTITTAAFCNFTNNSKINNLACRFDSGVYFMHVNFPQHNVSSIELHKNYSRNIISLYTSATFKYNLNLFNKKFTQINLALNYTHDFNLNKINKININLLDNNFVIKQKRINYQELNLDASININLTKNTNIIVNISDSLCSNGNKINVKLQYIYTPRR